MLSALNTGHEGGCGTIHANSACDVPARLHALGALSTMTPEAVTRGRDRHRVARAPGTASGVGLDPLRCRARFA
jgi:Flp pilus assembly CpaF family ATPase